MASFSRAVSVRCAAGGKGRLIAGALSLLALLALWALAAWLAHSRYFPDPAAVGAAIAASIESGELPDHTGITLARVAASFVLAFAIGSPIGIALGRFPKLDLFFDSWLILFLNLPALIVIILCFVWLGQNEVAAVTAVALNKIPNVAVILREGTQAMQRDYDEMATFMGSAGGRACATFTCRSSPPISRWRRDPGSPSSGKSCWSSSCLGFQAASASS